MSIIGQSVGYWYMFFIVHYPLINPSKVYPVKWQLNVIIVVVEKWNWYERIMEYFYSEFNTFKECLIENVNAQQWNPGAVTLFGSRKHSFLIHFSPSVFLSPVANEEGDGSARPQASFAREWRLTVLTHSN